MQELCDVIVVGGGGSGLATAVSAAEHGAAVILLEKCPTLGGTTGIAVGSFTANRTPHQRNAGIEDNPDDHEADAGQFGPREAQVRNNADLRRFFLEHVPETLEWLMGFGLTFHGPHPEPPNRVPRMHQVVPNAKAYVATLQSRFLDLGGLIHCDAPVEELIFEAGRIQGVITRQEGQAISLRARRGVVLAAGDYANSPDLIGQYKGPHFRGIEGINPHAIGDGHRLAEKVGAQLVNMDLTYGPELRFVPPPGKPFSQLLPATGLPARIMGKLLPWVPAGIIQRMIKRLLVTWQHPEDALFEDGAVLINARGERFGNEKVSPEREVAVSEQPGKIAYILLDQRIAERYSQWPHFISTAPEIAYAYVEDYCRLRSDVTLVGSQLEDLAAVRNLPPETLRQTIADFNRYVAGHTSDPWGRTGDKEPLQGDRWVLLGPAKAYFTTTEGGVQIDMSGQALDAQGQPILGLYAVGQNGLGGLVLWGHGLHIAWALTSGRLVGRLLAENNEIGE